MERVTGSLAFAAVARLVLVTAKMPDEHGGGRILARAKSNLGVDTGGYRYELCETQLEDYPGIATSYLVWRERLEGTARELLAQAEVAVDTDARTALSEASEWLRETLGRGMTNVAELKTTAGFAGLAWRTVERAANKLGVAKKRAGFGPGSAHCWSLPASAPTDAMLAKPEAVAHMEQPGAHGATAPQPDGLPWRTVL